MFVIMHTLYYIYFACLGNIEMDIPALDVIYLHMASFPPLVSKMLAKLLERKRVTGMQQTSFAR